MSLHTLIEKIALKFGVAVIFKRLKGSYDVAQNTAVRSKFGFWYIGNIFSRQDTVYGILQNGGIEINESELFIKLLDSIIRIHKDVVVYDIGANTGYYSLLSTSHHPMLTVEAFEPIPAYANQIKENLKINQVDHRVTIHNLALSDKNSKATLHLAGTGSTLEKDFQPHSKETLTVETQTLDSCIASKNLPIPHILKIDVENHELTMLKGAEQTIKKHQPILFIEIIDQYLDFKNNAFTETLSYLQSLNYNIYTLASDGGLNILTDIKKYHSTHIQMYTCLPKQSLYVIGS